MRPSYAVSPPSPPSLAPFVLVAVSLVLPPVLAAVVCVLAALSGYAGALVERWLFFAEAVHKVSLYYGTEAA